MVTYSTKTIGGGVFLDDEEELTLIVNVSILLKNNKSQSGSTRNNTKIVDNICICNGVREDAITSLRGLHPKDKFQIEKKINATIIIDVRFFTHA